MDGIVDLVIGKDYKIVSNSILIFIIAWGLCHTAPIPTPIFFYRQLDYLELCAITKLKYFHEKEQYKRYWLHGQIG